MTHANATPPLPLHLCRRSRPPRRSLALLATTALCAGLAALPALAQERKWSGHLEIGGKAGNRTAVGETALFVPLFQTFDRLIYTDLRGTFGREGSQELNAGLGIRQIIDDRWILGGYGFFDYRRSQHNNHFSQITLGGEAMTESLTLRANAYLPIGKTAHSLAAFDTARVGSTSIVVREGQERAMTGFDAEAGALLKGLHLSRDGKDQLWLHAGGYAFFDDRAETVWGPRLRAEDRVDDVLFAGSRLSLQAEYQNDEPRGSQGFFGARLRLPLQGGGERGGSGLTPLERRMTETVVRDIDIVAQAGSYGDAVTGIDARTGTALADLTILDAGSATLEQDIERAGAARQIFVHGSAPASVSATIELTPNQRVAGAFDVRHPLTGRVQRVGGTTIRGTNAAADLFALASGSSLTGFTLQGGRAAVTASGASDITLAGLRIADAGSGGITLENGSRVTIHDVSLSGISFADADGFSNFDPTDLVKGVAVRLNHIDGADIRNAAIDTVGTGLFANVSRAITASNVTISNTAKEGAVFHYVHGADLDRVNIDRTGADGFAFVAAGDIAYRNSSLTGLGAVPNRGIRSGINISGFSGDSSIIVGAESNRGYAFENLVIDGASNSGLMVMETRESSFRNIAISNVDLVGIQVMQMLRSADDLTFDRVTIDGAGNAGFWMMGGFASLNGTVTATNTPTACGRSPFLPTTLTQTGGDRFTVNGTEITGANVTTACATASNF